MKLAKVSAIGLLTTLSFSPSLRKASAEDSPPNGAAPVATGRDKSTIQSSSTANLPAWKRLSYREAENRPYLVHAAKAALEAERALAEFDKKHFPDGFQRYINQKENQRASLAVTERSVLLTRADARIQEILKTGRQKHHEAIFGDGGKDISLLDIASDAIDVATAFGPGKVGKLAIGIAGLKAAKFTKDHLIDEDAKVVRGALQHEYLQLPNDFREILDQFSKTYPGRNTPDRNKFWGEFDNIYRVSPNASDKEVFAQYPSIAKEAKNDQTAATVADLQQKVRLIQTQMKQLMLREGRDLSPIDLDQKLQSLKEERAKFVSRLRGELKNLEPELKEQLDKLQDSSTKHADVISAAMTGKLEDYLKNERLMDHRARVQEFRGYANGLATILGAIDPKAAPVVLQLAELGEAIADFAFSKLDPMMFTNVASAAMGLLSLLMSSGPSPEQMMLEKLDKLQESVDQMRQEMHDGFERIERILNGIGAQIIELQKQIQSLADQIASMDQKLDSLLRIVSMTYDSVKIIESASINEEKRKFEELLRHNQKKLDVVDPEEVKTAKKWLLDSLLARISQSGFVTGYYLVDDLKKEALLDKAILQLARRGVSEVPALAATLLSYDPKRDQLDSQDIFYQTVLILLNQNRSPLTLDETKQILDQAKKISRTASQWDKKANLVKALKIYQSQIDELFLSLSAECRLAAKDVNFSPPFHAGISPSQGLEQFRSLVFSYASPWQENISPLCVVNTEFVSEVLGKRKVDRNSHEAVLALSKFWNSISPDHTLRGGYSALHYEFTNASKPGGWEKTGDYLLDKDKADQQIYGIRFGWNFARLLPSYEASYQFAQLGEAEDYSGKKVRFKVASPEGYVRPVHLSVDDPREDKMISIGLPGTSGEGPNATVQRGNYYVRPVRAVPEFVAEFKSPITGNPIAQIQYRPNTKLYFYTLLDYKNYSPVLEEGIKEGQLPPRFWPKGGVFPKLYEDLKTQLQHWQTNITLRGKKRCWPNTTQPIGRAGSVGQ